MTLTSFSETPTEPSLISAIATKGAVARILILAETLATPQAGVNLYLAISGNGFSSAKIFWDTTINCVGEFYGINVSTSFTNMNQPLGNTIGLWCEVMESIECLKGNGPDDIMSVVYHLGEEALKIAGINNPKEQLRIAISDGSAIDKFRQMVKSHGGSLGSLDNPETHKPA